MFRLGAIMTVAVAAAPWTSEEAFEEGNGEGRKLGWFSRGLKATVRADNFQADVRARQRGEKVQWTVRIRGGRHRVIDIDGCPGGYNWHIHAGKVGDGTFPGVCGKTATGGHTDNALGCGGATDEGTACDDLYNCLDPARPGGPKPGCNKDTYGARCGKKGRTAVPGFKGMTPKQEGWFQKGCEYGDLSGKMGQIKLNTKTQRFDDYHVESLSTYKDMSLVLHCCRNSDGTDCGDRVACGDFKLWR